MKMHGFIFFSMIVLFLTIIYAAIFFNIIDKIIKQLNCKS